MEGNTIVQPEFKVCSKCGFNGHNRDECHIRNNDYYMPGFRNKCSRCDQPGHNRNNRRKCSLFEQYRNNNYLDILFQNVSQQRQINLPEPLPINVINSLLVKVQIYCLEIQNILEYNDSIVGINNFNIISRLLYDVNNAKEDVRTLNISDESVLSYEIKEMLNNVRIFIIECKNAIQQILDESFTILELYELSDCVINRHHRELDIHVPRITSWIRIDRHNNGYYSRRVSRTNEREKMKINIIKKDFDLTALFDCSICYESKNHNNICETGCKHIFCVDCITSYYKTRHTIISPCPMCRDGIKELVFSNDVEVSKNLTDMFIPLNI